jgi:hypothetical protein
VVGTRLRLVSFLLLGTAGGAGAVDLVLSPRALTEALDIGQSRVESVRTRFHQPYRLIVSRPPVDEIQVVTPFRRIALAAEARARLGERSFAQRDARATLAEAPDQIDLLVELTFHPQNTFIGVPEYRVRLLAATSTTTAAEPRNVSYVPRFGPRVQGMPLPYPYPMTGPGVAGGQPLTGGTIVVQLDGQAIDTSGLYDVLVLDGTKELARTRVDFRGLR